MYYYGGLQESNPGQVCFTLPVLVVDHSTMAKGTTTVAVARAAHSSSSSAHTHTHTNMIIDPVPSRHCQSGEYSIRLFMKGLTD